MFSKCKRPLAVFKAIFITTFIATFSIGALQANALEEIVVKQEFKLAQFTTETGKVIKNIRVGFETYGTLNAKKNNVILIAHHFSGSSHAAGKYAATDAAAGYWDAVIGPGKAFDTSKYFIISSDTLVNINPKDPHVITTGPLSIDPATSAPYGTSFPVVGYRDFVAVQKALIDSLGITHLEAVAGPSAGAMQAIQWAVDYPKMVERVIAVIAPGFSIPAYTIATFNSWSTPIVNDPLWKGGAYTEPQTPKAGLASAFKAVTLSTVDYEWAEKNFGNKPADVSKLPTDNIANPYLIEAKLAASGQAKVANADANSFLYMVRASQAFNVESEISKISARILFVSSETDALFPPSLAEAASSKLNSVRGDSRVLKIKAVGGHLVGILNIANASTEIADFLAH